MRTSRRIVVPRIFCRFPDRSFGIGLLLLRTAIGSAATLHAFGPLFDSNDVSSQTAIISGITAIAGVCLLVGFLTPVMSLLAFLGVTLITYLHRFTFASTPAAKQEFAFTLLLALGLALVGPGAYSIDARLFGRRQVIIPRAPDRDGE